MELGKKIKKIRISKKMTQSELAGSQITRNMLSQIENGLAVPSVGTIIYIAEKLEMPVGYFLADSSNDFIYQKMICIDSAKEAFASKKYKECIDICENSLSGADDELNMILSECYFYIGQELFSAGKLLSAHKEFAKALKYAEKTIYNTEYIKASVKVYFEFIGKVIPSLIFEPDNTYDNTVNGIVQSNLHEYLSALRLIDEKKICEVQALIDSKTIKNISFENHIKAKILMCKQNYPEALEILLEAEKSSDSADIGINISYMLCSDIEICCRELKDFENAYLYATKKSKLFLDINK